MTPGTTKCCTETSSAFGSWSGRLSYTCIAVGYLLRPSGAQRSKTEQSQWSYGPAGLTHVNFPYAIYGCCLRYILKCFVKSILSYLQGNISSGENLAKHNSTVWILLMLHLPLLLLLSFFAILLPTCPLLSIKHSSSYLGAENLFIFPGFYLPPCWQWEPAFPNYLFLIFSCKPVPFNSVLKDYRGGEGEKVVLFLFIETPAQINGNYHSKSIITGL